MKKNKNLIKINDLVQNKIKLLDLDNLANIKIDIQAILEPKKDCKHKIVIESIDTDFCDSETVIEYQPDEHSERKQVLLFKTRFLCYILDDELKNNSKDRYILDICTKRPNYAKCLLACKTTKEHYKLGSQFYPVCEIIPNYVNYNDNIINAYMITPLN